MRFIGPSIPRKKKKEKRKFNLPAVLLLPHRVAILNVINSLLIIPFPAGQY